MDVPLCVDPGTHGASGRGAELTSLEQLGRHPDEKDFCGPVDTISVGYGAPVVNAKGNGS